MRKKLWSICTKAAAITVLTFAITTGAGNTAFAKEEAATVTMSAGSGCYDNAFNLTMTCDTATKIYYTTDGSDPRSSDTRKEYTVALTIKDRSGANGDDNYVTAVDPVEFDSANVIYQNGKAKDKYKAPSKEAVDKATVIKAAGMDAAGNYTSVATNTYFVGQMDTHIKGIKESCQAAGVSMSIMSISMDYDDLFDQEKGIYVKGNIFKEKFSEESGRFYNGQDISDTCRKLDANYNQRGKEWERAAHIDYIESDGTTTECKLQQDCGIRIQGNYSRSDMQKGLRLYAREEYGKKNFKYNFFGNDTLNSKGKPMDKYKKLTLRAGGNAAFAAKYNDAYWQSLIKDLKCDTQSSRVCVVYIDGEYWGLYILQEDYCDNYWEEKYGVNKDNVISYKGDAEKYGIGYDIDDGELPEGQNDVRYFWNDLLKFYDTHANLNKQDDYEAFEKLVDVESVRDYFAVNLWLNNKWDWPGKNWLAWKTTQAEDGNAYADGRWRLCFYDLDFGGASSKDYRTNTVKEDNYKTYGMLDLNTENPVVLMFGYLMTNDTFRNEFNTKLLALSSTNFEKDTMLTRLDQYLNTYKPLYDQFFTRYDGNGSASQAINSEYLSYAMIKEFATNRRNVDNKYIQQQIDFINSNYGKSSGTRDQMAMDDGEQPDQTPTPVPTKTPQASTSPTNVPAGPAQNPSTTTPSDVQPTLNPNSTTQPTVTPNDSVKDQTGTDTKNDTSKKADRKAKKTLPLKVTARKGKKTVTIKTLKKAVVKVTATKKVIYKGKKVTKRLTIPAKKNKTGKIVIKLSKPLNKNMKLKVTVSKKNYQTKKQTIKVK